MGNKFQEILDHMQTSGSMEFFNNDHDAGICIRWSEKGRGFGEYTFYVDKKTGVFGLDNEHDYPSTVWKTIERIIDDNPVAIKKLFLQMMCAAKVDDDRWVIEDCGELK